MAHSYRLHAGGAKELLKALGLEGHRVHRIELVFDVNEAVRCTVHEFALEENHVELCRVLTAMGPWMQDVSTVEDDIRQVVPA